MKCHGYLFCESIDIDSIKSEAKYKQVAVLTRSDSTCFIFPYGALVIWSSKNTHALDEFKDLVLTFAKGVLPEAEVLVDEFDAELSNPIKLIHEDNIFLPDDSLEVKLSISHAIAQSLRLSHIEDDVLRLMKTNRQIPLDLASTGKVKKSKKEISKLQGELYLKKTKISFEYSILDKPEFFWLYPEFDGFYSKTIDYLELKQRIEILSKKFQTIDEILSILSNELNHRHSSRLEWIIILLILIEIVIFFLQDVFKVI